MKKSVNKKTQWRAIIMHLKRHHRKYLCGIFWGFAVVKMIILFFWLSPVLNIGNIFAGDDEIILSAENLEENCDTTEINDGKIICNYTTAHDKYIVEIEPWTFEAYKSSLQYIELSGNKISNIKSWTFEWLTELEELYLNDNQIFDISSEAFSWTSNSFTMYINNNCLSDDEIWELESIATIEQNWQKVCLYVDYDSQPDNWINWVVNASLTLTGNAEWISKYILNDEIIEFEDNDIDYFDVEYLSGQQEELQEEFWNIYDIINLPEECQFPASVTWIDSNVITINSSRPNCTRENPTKPELNIWNTWTITLNCTDTEWIETTSLNALAIELDNDIISLSDDAMEENIDGGTSFTFTYTALKWWDTSLILKAWEIENNIWNTNNNSIESENIHVLYGVNSLTWKLVEFSIQLISGWAASDSVMIKWLSWATWWYDYFDDNNTAINWANYHMVSDETVSLSFNDSFYNGKYICAFGQKSWYETYTICTDNKIQIDNENPEVTIISPANNTNFTLWSKIKLKWSGKDEWDSGIDFYILSITKPSSSSDSIKHWVNITDKDINLNETWTWHWSITVYDKAGNSWVASWMFYVNASGEPPIVTWDLIKFQRDVSSTWVQGDYVVIELLQWANWWYIYFNTGNAELIDRSGWYRKIPAWWRIDLSSENNGEFVCAFGSKWGVTKSICSTHPIKIDTTNPEIALRYPSNWSDFKRWVDLILTWSWSDRPSGISWYTLTVLDPSWTNYSYNFWNTGTNQSISLDKTWDWYRFVKAYDYANHFVKSDTWYFYVNQSWWVPENWFYLISPILWANLNLWDNVGLSRSPWLVNDGYTWEIKNISWTTIASGNTTWVNVVVDSWYFTAWAFSWSVRDNYTNITKSIPLFFIVDTSNIPDLEVRQFNFDEIEDADLDEYYQSDIISIRWLSDDWYTLAYLWNWRWALYINDDFVWTTWYVKNWDKVYIEMKASDEYSTTIKTTLYVWVWQNVVSWDFKITTKNWINGRNNSSLTPMQKLWWVIYVDSLVEMYKYDQEKLATFLSTFMQLLQDESDHYSKKIKEAEEDWDEKLAEEYRLYKEAIDFLYVTVKYRYDNLDVEDRTIYIAPNGKQYLVEYDEARMAYTSPDFTRVKYFPTWELFTNHIDVNNPKAWSRWIQWNVITTHNGKVYTIYQTNWKWTSTNFKTAKYFDTKEDIINHILANNPASNWNHKIDTDFDEVKYTAPNGKVYKIFKTSSEWNNPNMYSSYNFVNAKYFTSLEAAKKFIDQNNKK